MSACFLKNTFHILRKLQPSNNHIFFYISRKTSNKLIRVCYQKFNECKSWCNTFCNIGTSAMIRLKSHDFLRPCDLENQHRNKDMHMWFDSFYQYIRRCTLFCLKKKTGFCFRFFIKRVCITWYYKFKLILTAIQP